MPVVVWNGEKFPGADRVQLGEAALSYCRAVREIENTRARFYWHGPNGLAFIVEADSWEHANQATGAADQGVSSVVKALFNLADLMQPQQNFRLTEPAAGEAAYRAIGR